MSERLYYTDAYCTTFDAEITACLDLAGRPALVLNRSCFYPTSGGQPHDLGTLAGSPVVDVVVDGANVLHVLDRVISPGVGETVHGVIDWDRRYDLMQQHSGQHLLSQIFDRQYGWETVSVHFGATESTLDLAGAGASWEQIEDVEHQANQLAYTALPITAYFVDHGTLGQLPLRRPPKVTGKIRIVEIAGYDYSACGGTHVRTTAEIVPIKILRLEHRKESTRLTFKCGLRAYQDYALKARLLGESAAHFSSEAIAVPELTARMLDQNRALLHQNKALMEKVAAHELRDLLDTAQRIGAVRVVHRHFSDRSLEELKTTASLLRKEVATAALLATSADEKLTLIFCRSDDVAVHMGVLLRDSLATFGGGGGGRPEFAQGGGVDPSLADRVLEYAYGLLRQQPIK